MEDITFLTISLEPIMATLVVDAYEGQYVEIFDVQGAYLNTDMPDEKRVRLKLEGEFVDTVCGVNPYHIPNTWDENGKKVLYLSIMKALYGCIESALLWYELYENT